MKAVSMKGICMSFPGILANDHVDFEVEQGSIHCLLGENGSGKTTLMNVLFGLYHKDSGDIRINGKAVEIRNPADAESLGVGMVHQHFMLIPQLTILQNIILGSEPGGFVIDMEKARDTVQALVDKYSFKLDIDQKVSRISVGMKQKVEILKLLYRGARIVIFDEPTAVLTPQEVKELFVIFHTLIEQGCTIIFITHKLNEIFDVSDYVTVLRKGRCIGTVATKEIDAVKLSEMMIGRQLQEIKQLTPTSKGDYVLKMEDVHLLPNSSGVSFGVRCGEIVGVAGIDGNGQLELEELITGVRHLETGSLSLCGCDASGLSIRARKGLGMAYIPSDRGQSGAMASATVEENFLLGHQDSKRYRKHGFVDYKTLDSDCLDYQKEFDIRFVSISQPFGGLSGGNQQKVVLAREVGKDVNFVLAAQPIRGLDISAIEFIHNVLLKLRNEGKGVLLISAELSELLEVCDRIIVLCDGEITGSFERSSFDESTIGLAMIGHKGGVR